MSKLRAIFVVPALGLGLACTAILNPRDDVQRCGSASDCEASGDNRYDVVCVFPEDMMLDSTEVDKICVAEFAQVSCDEMSYLGTPDHPLTVALMTNDATRYICQPGSEGAQGCAPPCAAGLEPNGHGVCDVPGTDPPAVSLAGASEEIDNQDIFDQFCRSFFCDESFVCERESKTCIPCSNGRDFGFGGCGTVYTSGVQSCIYADPEADCAAPESDVDEPHFGACM